MERQRITVIKIRRPVHDALNEDLQWFGSSLGLFGLRDKDKSCFRIFIELVKSLRSREMLSSDNLAHQLHLSRGTVVHHLNKLMESGMVVHERRGYILRTGNMEHIIEELQKDLNRAMGDLLRVAKKIDDELEL
ncbi:helix-turn-helix transcriptional regulator [Candidatus Woesearchaeota archaeon]|nr:helix-turn-helix transcriptional regulator [Candidatus Woesearchaeota archaeon]